MSLPSRRAPVAISDPTATTSSYEAEKLQRGSFRTLLHDKQDSCVVGGGEAQNHSFRHSQGRTGEEEKQTYQCKRREK
ncbi:hypothetical protein KFK09_006283 [Dendrobium nobile]|uniref:Uncharacterized protein n=1 Tax=Dendrobium nobile TaxID=94219 RepID=A0A8T3BT07_DENNO|nr:hypothetical protein KFK09_006283 [Dendrobium nobile]